MELRVAGAQICVSNESINENVKTLSRAIKFASEEKADILLTPEGSLSGYSNRFNAMESEEALEEIVGKAKSAKVGLALGTCFFENDGLCYNQLRFYDKNGGFIGFHAKTLTCGTLTDPPKGEIEYYSGSPLRVFNFQGITIGGLICNDLWANPQYTPQDDPHLSQQLARMGARIIFHAVNGARDSSDYTQIISRQYHESNLQIRAKAGGVWIVTVDNAFPETIPNSSSGGVISPDGSWIRQLPRQGEHFFTQTVELNSY